MGRNQIGALTVRALDSTDPQLLRPGATLFGSLDKFGLGLCAELGSHGQPARAEHGGLGGHFQHLFLDRSREKLCAVLMTQMLPGLADGPQKLLADFDRAVYASRR
jgi:hypothetical protein